MNSLPPVSFENRVPAALKTDPSASREEEKLKTACQGFEAMFLHTLLREGRGNSSVSISSGEGRTMGIVQDLQDEAVGNEMSRGEGVGLSQMLYHALSKKAQVSSSAADNLSERRYTP